MIAFALVFGIVGSFVGLALFRGLVFSYLWLWFVVPLGVPEINLAHAFGLAVMIALFTNTNSDKSDPKDTPQEAFSKIGKMFLMSISQSLIALLFGLILRGFV